MTSAASTSLGRFRALTQEDPPHDVVVDPHTADGIKVGLERREAGVPLICIETALPAKFSTTIREALGREPKRPSAYEGLEALPQRFVTLPANAAAVKAYVAEHAHA